MKNLDFKSFEYECDNGLRVILVHKPDFSRSFFLCGIKCGGVDRTQFINKEKIIYPSGCAHFLEHVMFHYQGGDVSDQFAQLSCQVNAFTSPYEMAFYFSTTEDPEQPLDLLLRFVQSLDLNDDIVEKEKGIILSEWEMVHQNPDSAFLMSVWNALYDKHPMKDDVIGKKEDILSMDKKNLESFYRNHYDPKNMILIGVSAQDPQKLINEIKKIESSFPSCTGRQENPFLFKESLQVADPFYVKTMDINNPYVGLAVKLKPEEDPQVRFLLETQIQLTLDAYFSTFSTEFQTWIDQRILNLDSGAECDVMPDHAYLLFYAQTAFSDQFYKIIEHVLWQMQNQKISDDIFTALKNRLYAQQIRVFDRFEGLAIELFQSKIQGISLTEQLDLIASLDAESTFQAVSRLDLSSQSHIVIKGYDQS